MRKVIVVVGLIILFTVSYVPFASSQLISQGQAGIFVNGGMSKPMGALGTRYKVARTVDAGFNYGLSDNAGVEVRLVYGKFDKTSGSQDNYILTIGDISTSYAIPPEMEHYYRYVGITPSMVLSLTTAVNIKPYILIAWGLIAWGLIPRSLLRYHMSNSRRYLVACCEVVHFGTGIYRFYYHREASRSWVKIGSGSWEFYKDPISGEMLDPYPERHFTEWQWGFNGGVGIGIRAGSSAVIDIKARWETILGDLWPAHFLGMRKVSPIHTLQITGGIKLLF